MLDSKIKELVSQMTLEEKASLLSGSDMWHTKAIERLGIPQVMVSDGPHGLRKQDEKTDILGQNTSISAVCFPAACATASSWDPDLIETMGQALGQECQAENVSIILGPAVNIKRSPLCGRNFEYVSEDPYLAGRMAAGIIKGIQSQNVGTSIKHFAANSMEWRRMSSTSNLDMCTLREIYLTAFEMAVKEAQPWTVMCSYNRINGTFSSDNHWLLTELLRDEWGFKGYVVSDWGAVNDRTAGVHAGMDLQMPGDGGICDAKIVSAVNEGRLDEKDVDTCAERILAKVFEYTEKHVKDAAFDRVSDAKLAAEVEKRCIVLLKNEGSILPLKKEQKVLLVGGFAENPRYQGGGSSHINSSKVISVLDAVKEKADDFRTIAYEKGFDETGDVYDPQLAAKAIEAAKEADTVVVFAGLPDSFESEGYDRSHLELPQCQNKLIGQIAEVNQNVVVVLHNGSPVTMPWLDQVKGLVELYLGGQSVGEAAADVLSGRVNPSGHLAETFPLRIEDTPCYLDYPGNGEELNYSEGVFVGYRWYTSRRMPVLFPFGYGLSYTTFAYSHLKLDKKEMTDDDTLTVSVDVTNTGSRAGRTVVQLYVSDQTHTVTRPVRELKGFANIELEPGQTRTVTMTLDRRSFAYWDMGRNDWHVGCGKFQIQIGTDAQTMVLTDTVTMTGTRDSRPHYHENSTVGQILSDPKAVAALRPLADHDPMLKRALAMADSANGPQGDAIMPSEAIKGMIDSLPLRAAQRLTGQPSDEAIGKLLALLNSVEE